ncbi:hypothetical protein [Streptomyces sp. NPDC051636]|uniref:hypothetical protein n=1 Tax=Streptomyces sp. NPDC051636 TaxID=3365663 RepID=UPI0037886B69
MGEEPRKSAMLAIFGETTIPMATTQVCERSLGGSAGSVGGGSGDAAPVAVTRDRCFGAGLAAGNKGSCQKARPTAGERGAVAVVTHSSVPCRWWG